jgi:outer membrane protein
VQSHVKTILCIAALVCLTSLELGSQTSSDALPNAPRQAQPLFLAYGQSNAPLSTTASPPQPGGVPSTLTRQQAERIALANNPHIHISELIAKVQHQAVRERETSR